MAFFFTKQGFLICLESICCDTGWHCRIATASINSVLGAGYQKHCIVIMVKILCEIDSGFANEILKKHLQHFSINALKLVQIVDVSSFPIKAYRACNLLNYCLF